MATFSSRRARGYSSKITSRRRDTTTPAQYRRKAAGANKTVVRLNRAVGEAHRAMLRAPIRSPLNRQTARHSRAIANLRRATTRLNTYRRKAGMRAARPSRLHG